MSEPADKLIEALRNPDPAFRTVPNTVRQSSADIVTDLATAIRATAHKLLRTEARIVELEAIVAMYKAPTHCKIDQHYPNKWPCPRCGEGPCHNVGRLR